MIKKSIPNFITILNILTGCLSIYYLINGHVLTASYLVFLSAVLDFLDGFAARMLKAYSDFGKQLDSLADLISFGVAPALIMYSMSKTAILIYTANSDVEINSWIHRFLLFLPFLIIVFSAIRLAKFNLQEKNENKKEVFSGLPTPANAMLIASLPVLFNDYFEFSGMLFNVYFLSALTIFLCMLMISPLKMFSLKTKSYGFRENIILYHFLALSLIGLVIWQISAIPVIIFLYIIISIITSLSCRNDKIDQH